MDAHEFELALSDLETRIARLRALYELYFQGIERLEPQVARKEVERILAEMRKERPRNTALRFRYQTLLQRWTTFTTHWQRISRQIEEGTYRRDLLKVKRRAVAAVADEAPKRLRDSAFELDEADMIIEDDPAGFEAEPTPTATRSIPVQGIGTAPAAARPSISPFARVPRSSSKPPPSDEGPIGAARTFGPPRAEREATRRITTEGVRPADSETRQLPLPPPSGQASLPPRPIPSAASRANPPPPPPSLAPRPPVPSVAPRPKMSAPPSGPLTLTPEPPPTRPIAMPPPSGTQKLPRADETMQIPRAADPGTRKIERVPEDDPELRRVYDRYISARRKNNESTDVTFESLASSLQKMMPALREKHRDVKFEVVLKNGRVALKPVSKKD